MSKVNYSLTLGQTYPKEYTAFGNIRNRCNNPKCKDYKNYGGRGIKLAYANFKEFLNDVGPAISKAHTIDRIDNNGNYEPGNVRWATKKEQACNKRNSILITYLCRTLILGEWCDILKLKYGSLYKAINSNSHINPSEVFADFLISKIEREHRPVFLSQKSLMKKISKQKPGAHTHDREQRYYHDLQKVLIKHGLMDRNGVMTPGKPLILR